MTLRLPLAFAIVSTAALAFAQAAPQSAPPDAAGLELYEKKIRPLFAEQCYACHGPKQQMSGLRLDRATDVRKGGNRGPLMAAGELDKSVLLKAIGYTDIHLRMPPKAKLKDEEIAAVAQWVKAGAPMPADDGRRTTDDGKKLAAKKDDWPARLQHWAYQPIRRLAVPKIQNPKSQIQNPIDSFLLAEMRKKGLTLAPPADRRTLIRRLYFDLIGLPPKPAEVDAFLADRSPNAYEKIVDRLLASPHYGERWGRHWLDLVRYAETLGHEFDYDLYNAWRYRDYVIRAFNADVPFDQFAMEHVAGDLLPKPRRNPADGSNESVIGTAFWWMGEGKHSPVDVRQEQADRMDNQIDVFGKAFLGQTLACARCHDHKFDPIRARDYYAIAGYLRSSRYQQAYLDAPERITAKARKLDALRATVRTSFLQSISETRPEGIRGRLLPLARLLAAGEGDAAAGRAAATVKSADDVQPDHPLYSLVHLAAERMPFAERAVALRRELQRRDAEARQAAAKTVLFEDFEGEAYEDWRATGDAFGKGPTRPGELRFDGGKLAPVPAGIAHSGLSSNRLEGVLRSKSFTIQEKYILIRAAGRDSRINVVLDGFQLIRDPIYGPCHLELKDDRMGWRVMDMSMWKGHHAYIELIDSTIPTLTHAGAEGGESRTSQGYIAVDEIRFSDSAAPPPAPVDPTNLTVLEGAAPDSLDALAARYQDIFLRSACSIGDAGARDSKFQRLAVCLGNTLSPVSLPDGYASTESSIPAPTCAPALVDGPGEDEDIFLRGNYKTPGGKAPRGIPQVCLGRRTADGDTIQNPKSKIQNDPSSDGSGRLELAQRLVSPENPLFARVIVNRVWLHHFGEGIVRSPDDFGHMGQRPTHPELLDWLAAAFMGGEREKGEGASGEQGAAGGRKIQNPKSKIQNLNWSLKKLHRLMVTSEAYRASSTPSVRAAQVDPQNRLLSHIPVRRLEAEAIRDSILAVSGRLEEKMYGPGVLTYLTPFMEGRGKPASGPLDGDGRRSIYIAVRRNFLTPMFLAFDYPTPFSCMGRRSVSNVPAQALSLMNGPFVQQQARLWAERILADKALSTPTQRVRALYETAYSRPPSAEETRDARAFLAEQARRYQAPPDDPRAWSDLCHVLINVKEFIFVR